jgi:hypothetical protein
MAAGGESRFVGFAQFGAKFGRGPGGRQRRARLSFFAREGRLAFGLGVEVKGELVGMGP